MDLAKWAMRFVPNPVKRELKQKIREVVPLNANQILSSLYSPALAGMTNRGKLTWTRETLRGRSLGAPLPFPPRHLMMGYADNEEEFLSQGRKTSNSIRRILEREEISLASANSVMEWGCASGRVLRHFAAEAKHCDFWGVDQDGLHINWAKENLSPPFKFLTCTAYPHLPFEDGKFKLVYGISVFTHLFHLVDMWLMEFRRVLAPGGYALFTIHDEHTWRWFSEQAADRRPRWLANEDFSGELSDAVVVFRRENSPSWNTIYTFFHTDWVASEWGRYLDVVSFEPLAEDYQTAVLLRKP